jgi:hypothetical protein
MILGISGRKQAGKNTTANILHGIVLKEQGFIKDWEIGDTGQLLIKTSGVDGWGEFCIERKDKAFVAWADNNMWPFVKLYSFADSLKWMCTELFDIPNECVWGTNDQKNQIQEHLLWENMPGVVTPEVAEEFFDKHIDDFNRLSPPAAKEDFLSMGLIIHKSGFMTAREFMQYLGTDVMRKMYEPIWVKACLKKIQHEQSQLAIIADVRFPSEVKAIEQAGGTLVRLTRKVFSKDNHSSEVALDDYPFVHVMENSNESINELKNKVKSFYLNLVKPTYLN